MSDAHLLRLTTGASSPTSGLVPTNALIFSRIAPLGMYLLGKVVTFSRDLSPPALEGGSKAGEERKQVSI